MGSGCRGGYKGEVGMIWVEVSNKIMCTTNNTVLKTMHIMRHYQGRLSNQNLAAQLTGHKTS